MRQDKGSAKCKWLTEDPRSRVGYYCGYHFPCPYIDADVACDCPCFKYALAFEDASKNPSLSLSLSLSRTPYSEYSTSTDLKSGGE